jgi:hypothetical protein
MDKDYEQMVSWHVSWGWPELPKAMFPKNGYIVHRGEKDLYSCFLYESDSAISWMEWFVGNKNTTKQERDGAKDYLINYVSEEAKKLGYKVLYTSVRKGALLNSLTDSGFVPEAGMINCTKPLL